MTGLVQIVELLITFSTTALATFVALNADVVATYVWMWLVAATKKAKTHWVTRMVQFACTKPLLSARLCYLWLMQKPPYETPAVTLRLIAERRIGVSDAANGKCESPKLSETTWKSSEDSGIECEEDLPSTESISMELLHDGVDIIYSTRKTVANSCGPSTSLLEESQSL